MNVLPLQDYTFTKLYDKAFMSLIDKKWIEWFKYIQKYNNGFGKYQVTNHLISAQKNVPITPDNFGGLFKCTFKLAL